MSILSTELEMVILLSEVQFLNAKLQIFVTESGMVICSTSFKTKTRVLGKPF